MEFYHTLKDIFDFTERNGRGAKRPRTQKDFVVPRLPRLECKTNTHVRLSKDGDLIPSHNFFCYVGVYIKHDWNDEGPLSFSNNCLVPDNLVGGRVRNLA